MRNRPWFFFALLFSTVTSQAVELTSESARGLYHLGTPERGRQQVEIAYGDIQGKTVIAVAPCERCPPAVYSYLKKESSIATTSIFTINGLYLIQYNDDSFIVVQPNAALGEQSWTKFNHANIYSKKEATAKSLSRSQIEQFAIKTSQKVMGQDFGKMLHKTGIYFLAAPVVHIGQAESQYNIELLNEDIKEINITPCSKCPIHRYRYLKEESDITGVDVYHDESGDYLFNIEEGVLVHAFANASGLGKTEWGVKDLFNVFSNNPSYIRHLITSVDKQSLIDTMLKKYFSTTKIEFDKLDKEAGQEVEQKNQQETQETTEQNPDHQ